MRLLAFLSLAFLLANCGGNKNADASKVTNIDSLFTMYPDSVEILVLHGNTLLKRYDYDNALKDGAKAYRLAPSNIEARFLYANALNNRATRSVSDVLTAQGHFEYILKKQPKNLKAYVSLASTYTQQGDFEKSFRYINEALHIDKRYRDAYVLKGSNYLKLGNRGLAKSSYETAIQQDPDFYEAYLFLGTLYHQENNPICLEYYKTAVQIKPKSVDVLSALAYGYQNFGHEEDAMRIYREILTLQKDYPVAYFQEGWIKQFKQNDIDSAMFFYQVALQKEPQYTEAWHNLGLCYVSKGERSLALQSFSKALKYNPDFTLSREEAEKLR